MQIKYVGPQFWLMFCDGGSGLFYVKYSKRGGPMMGVSVVRRSNVRNYFGTNGRYDLFVGAFGASVRHMRDSFSEIKDIHEDMRILAMEYLSNAAVRDRVSSLCAPIPERLIYEGKIHRAAVPAGVL